MKRGRNLYRASMYMESEFVWCNVKASWSNAYTEIYGANFQTASLSIGCIERKERMESIFLARLIRPSTLHLADSFTRISFLWLRTRSHTSLPNSAFFLVARRQAEWYIKKKKKKKKKRKKGKKKRWKKGRYIYENIYESWAFAHCTRPRGKIKTRCRGITRVQFIASCFHCLPSYDYLDTALTFDAWFRAAREPNIGDLSTNSP